jgi:hypothetical protein
MGLMPAQTAYDVPQPAERGPKPHDTGHHSPAPKTTGPARPVAFAHLAAAWLVPSRGSRGGETPYRGLVSLSCADVGVFRAPTPDKSPDHSGLCALLWVWAPPHETRSPRYLSHSSAKHPSKTPCARAARLTEKTPASTSTTTEHGDGPSVTGGNERRTTRDHATFNPELSKMMAMVDRISIAVNQTGGTTHNYRSRTNTTATRERKNPLHLISSSPTTDKHHMAWWPPAPRGRR